MGIADDPFPPLPGESEAAWRARIEREIADTRLVAELLDMTAAAKGITNAERAALRARIDEMQHEHERARALEMLAAEPAKPAPGSRGH